MSASFGHETGVIRHVDTAESFHALGCIHYEIGDMSLAVEAFQVASDMRSNLLGDDQDTVESYSRLGLATCGMGNHKGALESLQKTLQLEWKLPIGDEQHRSGVSQDGRLLQC